MLCTTCWVLSSSFTKKTKKRRNKAFQNSLALSTYLPQEESDQLTFLWHMWFLISKKWAYYTSVWHISWQGCCLPALWGLELLLRCRLSSERRGWRKSHLHSVSWRGTYLSLSFLLSDSFFFCRIYFGRKIPVLVLRNGQASSRYMFSLQLSSLASAVKALIKEK